MDGSNIPSIFQFEIRSFITSDAMMRPATDGTNETLPGVLRRGCGLFMLLVLSLDSGFIGSSSEYTTFNFLTPLFLSSLRITLARGSTLVL